MSERQTQDEDAELDDGEFVVSPMYDAIVRQLGYDPLADLDAEDTEDDDAENDGDGTEDGGGDEPADEHPEPEEASPEDGGIPRTPAAEGDESEPDGENPEPSPPGSDSQESAE